MKILIACEESQSITKQFRLLGQAAFSCDIQDCSGGYPRWHLKMDIFEAINLKKWDLLIAHPPCTYLSNAGIGWFNIKKYGENAILRHKLRLDALEFVKKIAQSDINYICIENPVGWLNNHWRKPDQIIQPWQFGDKDSKRTCLWLKNLPLLKYTKIVKPKIYGYYKTGRKTGKPIYFSDNCSGKDRAKIRSKTFNGIAKAIANQWLKHIKYNYQEQLYLF